MTKTVIQAGINQLFHYQKFNPNYIAEVLLKNRIKFSNPKEFNDPWDCKPCFSKILLDDPEVYARHVEYFNDLGRRLLNLAEPEIIKIAEVLRADRAFMEARIDECTDAMCSAIQGQYRIYCLSAVPDSYLMWAHYTENHKGICFGFESKSNVFCGALEVNYLEAYPTIDLTTENPPKLLQDTLLTKAEKWKYEEEFRLIAKEGEAEDFLVVEDGFIAFEPGNLSMVIAGSSISKEDKAALKEIARQRDVPVAIYQVKPAKNRYELELLKL